MSEKLIIAACFLTPTFVVWLDGTWWYKWLVAHKASSMQSATISVMPWTSMFFAFTSLASLAWHFPSWILARFRLHNPPRDVLRTTYERFDLRDKLGDGVFAKRWVQVLGHAPGNQLHLIDITHHEVSVPRLASSHNGLKLGHFSDVHLTGLMSFEYYREAIDRLMATQPDAILLTGDLIDYDSCLDQVQPLLESVEASLGCYFVLGNHDRRLKNVARLRSMLVELGWHDLGAEPRSVVHVDDEIYFIGIERPWFENPIRNVLEKNTIHQRTQAPLRIGLSHSPDQIQWARKLELDLLFCGHTHGGQVRLPWIGPIVAPSRYGSRYASGWFKCSPTLMHVSRGISGTHPLRVACSPEVSSIVIRKV
ncbi:MAG: metallophosphoesterase [Pirellulaceae bacterium]|nr:metallophosphoesterase [Pirellulaceae bacterium]